MTKYCKQERLKVYKLYLEYLKLDTQEAYRNYRIAEQDFKDRFHKRFDPLCLYDEYDVWGISWHGACYPGCKADPMMPIELIGKYKIVDFELIEI